MTVIGDNYMEISPEITDISGKAAFAEGTPQADSLRATGACHTRLPVAVKKVRNVDTEGLIHQLEEDIAFSTFVALPGVRPGMNTQATALVEEVLVESAADGLTVIQKVIVEVNVKVTTTIQAGLQSGSGPLLLLERLVGEGTTQTLMEQDVTLQIPAQKVDEIVLQLQDLTTEVITDKVVIQGIIRQQLFFIDLNGRGRHQVENIAFSTLIDLPGAVPGMEVLVQGRLEVLRFILSAPRQLHQKALLELFVKVVAATQKHVAVGTGALFKITAWVAENTKQLMQETVVTLPVAVAKILEIRTQVREITQQVFANKALLQGNIHQQFFFIGTDQNEHHQAEEIPFSVFIDLPGMVPGDRVKITAVVEKLLNNMESPRRLRQKIFWALNAVAGREVQLNLELTTEPLFLLEHMMGEATKQVLVVERTALGQPPSPPPPPASPVPVDPGNGSSYEQEKPALPDVLEFGRQIILHNQVVLPVKALNVKTVNGAITTTHYRAIAAGVVVEGLIDQEVNFVDLDHVVHQIDGDVPFTIMVTMPGITPQTAFTVSTMIEELFFVLDPAGKQVNQMIVLKATVTV
jgi:hypothetical protein